MLIKIEPGNVYDFTLKDNLLQVHFYRDLDKNCENELYILAPLIEDFDESFKTISDFRKFLPYKGNLIETTLLLETVTKTSVAEGWTVLLKHMNEMRY